MIDSRRLEGFDLLSLNDNIVDIVCLRDDIRSFNLNSADIIDIDIVDTSTLEETSFSIIFARLFLSEFFLRLERILLLAIMTTI